MPTIEAMAYGCFRSSDIICPIMDARRNQVYTGIYCFEGETMKEILKPCAMIVLD